MKHGTSQVLPAALLLLVILSGCSENLAPPSIQTAMPKISPVSTGTFTQPWSVEPYRPEDWDREFASMKEAGINLWIYQWVGDSKRKTLIYPTKLAGFTQSTEIDLVEQALKKAREYGCRVFLGLVFNDDWWQKEGSDRVWLLEEARLMNAVADELYVNYYARYPETIAGWYINWEMDNFAGYNRRAKHKENMIAALQTVASHLDTLNPDLPSSLAPFFNASGGADARQYGKFWYEIMSETSVDIVMLQDGIGVNHATLEQLPEWYRQVCTQVHSAGKACWSDLENFIMDKEGNFSPAPAERVNQQHQIAAQYVDRIVTFSFLSYMSPVDASHLPYYQAYMAYLNK